jgi:hypothetical protein
MYDQGFTLKFDCQDAHSAVPLLAIGKTLATGSVAVTFVFPRDFDKNQSAVIQRNGSSDIAIEPFASFVISKNRGPFLPQYCFQIARLVTPKFPNGTFAMETITVLDKPSKFRSLCSLSCIPLRSA